MYSSILVGAVQCSAGDSVVPGFRNFRNFKVGVEEFSGSRWMRIYWGLANFQDLGGMAYVGQ